MKKNQKCIDTALSESCQVCFSKFRPQFLNKLNSQIQCKKCKRVAHKFCYLPNCIDPQTFTCDVCLYSQKQQAVNPTPRSKSKNKKKNKKDIPEQIICFACKNPGLLKRVTQKLYGHPICLMFIDDVFVKSYEDFSFTTLDEKINTKKKNYQCKICQNQSCYVSKCFERKCSNTAHWFCILKEGQKSQFEDSGKWIHDLQIISAQSFNYLEIFVERFKKSVNSFNKNIYKHLWANPAKKSIQPVKIVYCPEHQMNLINCKCIVETPIIQQTQWVACDSCNKWYHFACEKISSEEQLGQSYMCMQCQQWYKAIKLNSAPILSYYPRMHFYDFIYIQYFALQRKYKDIELEKSLLTKTPFQPSLEYINEIKNRKIDSQIVKRVNFDIIKKNMNQADLENLDKFISIRKRQLVNQLQRIDLYISADLFSSLKNIRKIWNYRNVLEVCTRFYQLNRKDSKTVKNIIKILNNSENDQQQLQQIKQSTQILKEAISYFKNLKQKQNLSKSLIKFYEITNTNPLLMRHIKYNIVEQKEQGWKNFQACCLYKSGQDILYHTILTRTYSQFLAAQKMSDISLNYLSTLYSKYVVIYKSSSQTVKKQSLSFYQELYCNVSGLQVYQNLSRPQQQQPIILKQRTGNKTKSPKKATNKSRRTAFIHELQSSLEETRQKNNVLQTILQNSQIQYSNQFSKDFLTNYCYSVPQCISFSSAVSDAILSKWFYTFIKKLKLNKSSFINLQTKRQIKIVFEKNENARKIGIAFSNIYQLCENILSSHKTYQVGDFLKNTNESFLVLIKNVQINEGNAEIFTNFLNQACKIQGIQFLEQSINSDIYFKCVQYLNFIFSREAYFTNEKQFKTASLIFNIYYVRLHQNQAIDYQLQELQAIILKNEEIMELMSQVDIKICQDPLKLDKNINNLRKVKTLCLENGLDFYINKIGYLLKIYEAYEEAIFILPPQLIGIDYEKLPARYTIRNKKQSVDIQLLRNYLKKLQLIHYPLNSNMYNKIISAYSKAQKCFENLFLFIREGNKSTLFQNSKHTNNDQSNIKSMQRFSKQDILQIIKNPPKWVSFYPQLIQAESICKQHTLIVDRIQNMLINKQKYQVAEYLTLFNEIMGFPFQFDEQLITELRKIINSAKQSITHKRVEQNGIAVESEMIEESQEYSSLGGEQLQEMLNNIEENYHEISLAQCRNFLFKIKKSKIQSDYEMALKQIQTMVKLAQKLENEANRIFSTRKNKKNTIIDGKALEILKKQYQNHYLKIERVQQVLSQVNKISNSFGIHRDSLGWHQEEKRSQNK